jgi:hypothetical protein
VPTFHAWLRCYTKQADAVDGIGRRVWFASHHRGVKSLTKRRPSGPAAAEPAEADSKATSSAKGKGKSKKRDSTGGRKASAPAGKEESQDQPTHTAHATDGVQPRVKRVKSVSKATDATRVKTEPTDDSAAADTAMRSASRAAMGLRRLKTVS